MVPFGKNERGRATSVRNRNRTDLDIVGIEFEIDETKMQWNYQLMKNRRVAL